MILDDVPMNPLSQSHKITPEPRQANGMSFLILHTAVRLLA